VALRLFVAIDLPKRVKKEVAGAVGRLEAEELPVKWVDPELYHLTVKFLGPVERDRVEAVEGALEKIGGETAPFDLTFSGFGAFPTIRRPRVLWLGADASPAIRALKQDLEWTLAAIGFDRETRAFHPHVTLGRARDGVGAGAFRGLDDVVAEMDYQATVPVRELDLVHSRLSSSGPRYSVLSSTSLSPGG